jgi:hypothetical protein
MSTLYASFPNPSDAERAAGALLDHGAEANDISLLANEKTSYGKPIVQTSETLSSENSAKSGLSTTTPADAASGAAKGAVIGAGLGALAVAASLFIPGVGLVVGGGALATALMGGVGTAVAGAAAGGVTGLLTDQGVPEDVVTHYSNVFVDGGAILEVAVPSNKLDAVTAEALLVKYGASNIATVNSARVRAGDVQIPQPDPLIVSDANNDIAPVMYNAPVPIVVEPTPVIPSVPVATVPIVPTVASPSIEEIAAEPLVTTDPLVAAQDPLATLVAKDGVTVVPVKSKVTVDDEVDTNKSAEPFVDIVDPASGNVFRRPVETVLPDTPIDAQMTTLPPNTEVVADAATGEVHQTVGKSTVVRSTPTVVTDPNTGQRKPARIVEEQHAVVREPADVDEEGHAVLPVEGAGETVIVREKHIEYPS